MMDLTVIDRCKKYIYRFYRDEYGMEIDDAKARFNKNGNYLNLINASYGPYDIQVDVDLDEHFVRYLAAGWDGTRTAIDEYYENDEQMELDLQNLSFASWYDSAIVKLSSAIGHYNSSMYEMMPIA